MNWDWIWSFKDLKFNNCGTGIYMGEPSSPALGSAVLVDSIFTNVDQAIVTTFNCSNTILPTAGSFVIDNVDFTGAISAISYPNGTLILAGGQYVPGWMQGHIYSAEYSPEVFPNHNNETCYVPTTNLMCVQGAYTPPTLPTGLRNANNGKIFDRGKPTYDDWTVDQFISAKTFGCHGDGVTDDTECLQSFFNSVNFSQVAYLDHGAYVITNTILIPKNMRIMGEGWPMIMINSSEVWSDINNPVPAIRVGIPGDVGKLEMQDIVFETRGPVPGAILVEWNLEEDAQGNAGMSREH
jgi:glucan 1,3-beta-glucosidase